MRVGIEVGGTFTDLLRLDDDGKVSFLKVPSVPDRPDEGAYRALDEAEIDVGSVAELVHGSTVATNAVLERKGARVAFVTTRGFRDILALQRQDRTRTFDVAYEKASPIVRRRDCFEVTERVLADGTVETPLAENEIADLISQLAEADYGAVAVCFLNAYANPEHELRVADLIRQRLQHLVVTVSSEVAREFREYERASTTVIAAHVHPVISQYLERIEEFLQKRTFRGRFSVMQSNGGRLTSEGMRQNPVTALFSGPAAGVMGAIKQAVRSGHSDLITFDMGGTSTDVCLIERGEASLASQTEVDGLPVRTPIFDVVSVGAGCSSVVWVDEGGMLRVGPRSAGADPGPACYLRGGTEPTITDAHVIRGTIRPEAFLGGAMRIDEEAASRAFAPLAEQLGMSIEEAAQAAIRLATANIVRAIQIISTERGRDPRDHVLVGFGGAGPLHACEVAEDLGIERVLIPPFAGVLSAYGLLAADYRLYESVTRRFRVDADAPELIRQTAQGLHDRLAAKLAGLQIEGGPPQYSLVLEMRHVGQAFEVGVEIPLDANGKVADFTADALKAWFSQAHEQTYAYPATRGKPVEVISFRLGLAVGSDRTPIMRVADRTKRADAPSRPIATGNDQIDCRMLQRAGLSPGPASPGPAIVDDVTSTIFIPLGWDAEVDDFENLIITRRELQ